MNNQAASAHEVQMNASRWVIESRSENWSPDDQARLDAWLNESTAHMVAYWRASQAWNRTFRAVALRQPAAESTSRSGRNLRGLALRIAASLTLIGVLGTGASSLLLGPKYATYSTPVGGRETLLLNDGSKIELNTDTVLRYARLGIQREVVLDKGEAYFEVKHDPKHPFIVRANGRQITDIGTKFLVRGSADRLEVAMLEGRVLLSAPHGTNGPSSDLTAGNVAIATANETSVTKRPLEALQEELGWRSGILVFHHTTLATAIAEFNRYNTHKLVVADPEAAVLTIDGKFRANDVETFAEVAEDVLRLHVEHRGNRTVMSR